MATHKQRVERIARLVGHSSVASPAPGLDDDFGLVVSVMVRSMEELQQVLTNNPFNGQFDNHKDMHVFFLADELPDEKLELLLAQHNDEQLIAVDGRTVYCLLRISVVDSTLGKGFLDRKLKVPATARNWRTVKTLAEM